MKELVSAILTCSSSPKSWDAALDEFNQTFDVSASCMFSVHEFRDASMNFSWSRFFRDNLTPEIIDLMQGGGDEDDRPAYASLYRFPAQTFYEETRTFGVPDMDSVPRSKVRDITKAWGFKMRVAAALNKSGPWIDGLFCQHRTDSEWKSLIADDRAEIILPIMGNSISLSRTLEALRNRFRSALSTLDALGLGVFLVDETGCVVDSNQAAQRILDAADGLSVTAHKRLKLHSPDKTAELDAMIAAANGLLRGDIKASHTLMAAERPSGMYDYLVSVRSLSDSQAELETGFKCAFVTVIDPSRDKALSVDGIATLGQLTDAESAVVDLLVQGFRPAQVAEQRDVSLNTIKTQLKIISQKLRCSSQSDIIRVAAATRIPINEN